MHDHPARDSPTSWLFTQLRPYRRPLAALLTASGAEVALRVASPWTLKAVVDHVFGTMPPSPWLAAMGKAASGTLGVGSKVGLLAVIVLLGMVLHMAHQFVLLLHTRLFVSLGQRFTRDVRARLFAHLQCLTLAHHTKTPAGDAVYRLHTDAACLQQSVLGAAIPALFSVITLVAMFIVLWGISGSLALLALAVVPALWLSLRLHNQRVSGEAERVKELESRVLERAHESLSTIRLVKSFAREPYERARFSGATDTAMHARVALSRREAGFSFTVGALTATGSSLVLGLGGLLVAQGDISPGTLLLVLAYLGFVYGPLTAMTNSTAVVRDALASIRRVRDILAIAPERYDPPDASSLPRLSGAVRFDNVSFAYDPARPVIRGVSFEVPPGQLVAIVGPSGSGKTTLMSLLTRLYEPTEGRILVDDVDTHTCTLKALREQVSVVLQEAVLLSGSVRENLRYGRLNATDAEIEHAAHQASAHEFIAKLEHGYDTGLAEGARSLSGGQRQRLSIARAFLKDAPILVLDEPTSALDTLSEARFVEVLDRLRANRTIFVIAHRLSTVRRADRILVLNEGQLVASGTHEELVLSSSLYARLAGEFTDAESPEQVA